MVGCSEVVPAFLLFQMCLYLKRVVQILALKMDLGLKKLSLIFSLTCGSTKMNVPPLE